MDIGIVIIEYKIFYNDDTWSSSPTTDCNDDDYIYDVRINELKNENVIHTVLTTISRFSIVNIGVVALLLQIIVFGVN